MEECVPLSFFTTLIGSANASNITMLPLIRETIESPHQISARLNSRIPIIPTLYDLASIHPETQPKQPSKLPFYSCDITLNEAFP